MVMILCLVAIRGLLYCLIVPFDRTPDEKHHFKLIKAKQLQLQNASIEEIQRAAAEIEVVTYYSQYPTQQETKRIREHFSGATLPKPPAASMIYYLLNAFALRLWSFQTILSDIYAVRGGSIVCGMLVVLISFFIASELFPNQTSLIIGTPLLSAFIPQFSAMNGSINNDKLTEVFVAILFLLIVKIVKYGMRPRYTVSYLFVLLLALFSKRTALFMVPLSLVVLFVYYWRHSLRGRMHLTMLAILAAMLGIVYLLLWNDEIHRLIARRVIWMPPASELHTFFFHPDTLSLERLKYSAKFFIVMYWSFWGIFGYMNIHLHHVWYIGLAVLQLCSLGGIITYAYQVTRGTLRRPEWEIKALYLFVVSIFLVVTVPFLRSVIFNPQNPHLTQGRYLFPALIPICLLTVFGLKQLIPSGYERVLGAAGVIGLVVLDAVCLSKYILLHFHSLSVF